MGASLRFICSLACALALLQGEAQAQNSISDLFQNMKKDFQEILRGRTSQPTTPTQPEGASGSRVSKQDDQYYIEQAIWFSLELTGYGEKTTWKNPNTGHYGYVTTVISGGMTAGKPCKIYKRSLNTGDLLTQYQGTACRELSAMWVVSSEEIVTTTATSQTSPGPELSYVPPKPGTVSSVYRSTTTTTPSMPNYRDRATVREVQRQLTDLGYDTGPADGILGPRTRAAIRAFQAGRGLPETGEPYEELAAQLRLAHLKKIEREPAKQDTRESASPAEQTSQATTSQPIGSTTSETDPPALQIPTTYEESLTLSNEYQVLTRAGRYKEAIPIAKALLAHSEREYGRVSATTAAFIFNLAGIYLALGQYELTEGLYKKALEIWEKSVSETPRQKGIDPIHSQVTMTIGLAGLGQVYMAQGDYDRAEPFLKRMLAVEEKADAMGGNRWNLGRALQQLARLYQARHEYYEAEDFYKRAIAVYERDFANYNPELSFYENELVYARTGFAGMLFGLADVYQMQGRYSEAKVLLARSTEIFQRHVGTDSPAFAENLQILASVEAGEGNLDEAEELYKRSLSMEKSFVGQTHPAIAEILDKLAAVYGKQNRYQESLSYSRQAVAVYRDRAERLGTQRSDAVLVELRKAREIFIHHVQSAWEASKHQSARYRALAVEAFESAQLAHATGAAVAVANMAARFAAGDDALGRIVRTRQDAVEAQRQTDNVLINMLGRPPDQRNRSAEDRLRREVEALDRRINELDEQLNREVPEYAELGTLRPVPLTDIQKLLRRNEALVVYLVGADNVFIWAVRRDELMQHVVEGLGREAVMAAVADLRLGLDPTGLSRIPPFDRTQAFSLYQKIFAPVERLLKGVRHVFVVPDGALQSLPLSVLVTERPQGSFTDYSGYRHTKWLALKYAMTTLPSVSSLRALRRFAKTARARLPFVGFGDPALSDDPGSSRGLKLAALFRRGPVANVEEVRRWPSLPDTADELRAIARALDAGDATVYLRERATETRIKTMDLSDYRVIGFATHGLVSGDLKGFAEPGLVLTPPDKGSLLDDGILAASEVAQLKLDADWVILSACNTAAADGSPGGQALSGLAKAFFYAGSRALLVSHWPVESGAAVKLTTRMFAEATTNPNLGRAEALRNSMLALMRDKEQPHYTHPMFWAPFVVVGEGGLAGRKKSP